MSDETHEEFAPDPPGCPECGYIGEPKQWTEEDHISFACPKCDYENGIPRHGSQGGL